MGVEKEYLRTGGCRRAPDIGGMRYRSTRRRWRSRHTHGKSETWLRIGLLVLMCSAALWLIRVLQTSAVHARTADPHPLPVPNAQLAPAPAPAPPAAPPDREGIIALIQTIWGADWALGVAIADCESVLQPDAVHTANPDGSVDMGLFQINSIHGRSKEELLDPVANTRYAYTLFQAQGTAPWESSRPCWEGSGAGS